MIFYFAIVERSTEPAECYTGQYRLSGNQTGVSYDSPIPISFTYGVLQICVNGTYYSVCTNDTYSNVNIEQTASFACGQLGYSSGKEIIYIIAIRLLWHVQVVIFKGR